MPIPEFINIHLEKLLLVVKILFYGLFEHGFRIRNVQLVSAVAGLTLSMKTCLFQFIRNVISAYFIKFK